MSHYRSGALIAATALAGAAACAAGGSSAGAARTHAASPAAKPLAALSASFATPSTGWLLGEHGQKAPRVLIRKTVDGGRSWFAVSAPAAPAADSYQSSPPPNAVGSILFTSERDGWAFGPALWRTVNGGATWRPERAPGPVTDLVAAGGLTLALTSRADRAGHPVLRVYAQDGAAGGWRPVPGTAVTGFAAPSLAASGGTGYLLADRRGLDRPVLLAGPATGSGRWRPLPQPCAAGWSAALAAAPGGWLFIGCGSEPSAGNQPKTAYLSHDGGHSWRRVASPPVGGYLGRATMSAGGTIFLSGARMDIYLSRNRGRGWQESPSLAAAASVANAGFSLVGTTVSDAFGVAIQQGVSARQVWLTRNGGRGWTPVTVH